MKLHILLDLSGSKPKVMIITQGKVYEVNIIDQFSIDAGAIYIMDRGYIDFTRLHAIYQAGAFFINRAKDNFMFRGLYSLAMVKTSGLQYEQIITTMNFYSRKDYPEKLRWIRFFDKDNNRRLVFLNNKFTLPALTIA